MGVDSGFAPQARAALMIAGSSHMALVLNVPAAPSKEAVKAFFEAVQPTLRQLFVFEAEVGPGTVGAATSAPVCPMSSGEVVSIAAASPPLPLVRTSLPNWYNFPARGICLSPAVFPPLNEPEVGSWRSFDMWNQSSLVQICLEFCDAATRDAAVRMYAGQHWPGAEASICHAIPLSALVSGFSATVFSPVCPFSYNYILLRTTTHTHALRPWAVTTCAAHDHCSVSTVTPTLAR